MMYDGHEDQDNEHVAYLGSRAGTNAQLSTQNVHKAADIDSWVARFVPGRLGYVRL